MHRLMIVLGMAILLVRSAWSQDTLQVGYNYRTEHGWYPFEFYESPNGHFAPPDSNYVVCRVSAEALGYQQGDVICDVNIWAQWPDETWQDLSLGCYALDAVRFLDCVDEYGTPLGHYVVRAEIDLPGENRIVWADLWIVDESPEAIDDLMIQLQSSNIYLWWTEPYDDVGVVSYVVYRSMIADSLGDSLAGTMDTTYADVGVAGTIGTDYYYTVKAVDGAGHLSEESNRVGEFDRILISVE